MIWINLFLYFTLLILCVNGHWSDDGPTGNGLGKLSALDVICGKDHMTVRAEFAGPFHGIVASKGTYGQDNCVYIKPYSGVTHATFKVYYDQCGTKPDLQGRYYENTVVIQYGTDIIEAWDEAKRLRCEWFEAYEKPATFRPAIPVADLDVVEMNFQGDDIDCWMEIQEGKGPWGREVSRIVPVGQPMTIVIAINDYGGEFDMRVKSCFAHDGIKPPIHLTDEHGCVLRPKMLTKFEKVKDPNGKATVISYSHFYAFKFPDSMNVQIQCTVEVCRHGCPNACQKTPYQHQPDRQFKPQVSFSYDQRSAPSISNKPHEVIKEQPEVQQDLQGLATSDVSSLSSPPPSPPSPPPFTVSQTSQVKPASSLPSEPGLSVQPFPTKTFDSKRLPVYSHQEDKVQNNSSENVNNQNVASNENDSDADEEPIAEEGEQSFKTSDYQPQSSTDNKMIVPQTPHHPPPPPPSSDPSTSSSSQEDDKPIFVPENEQKESILSKFANDNLDKASELFKDLGVADMAEFASGFIHGIDPNNKPNIASLLENSKVRDMVEAAGINLKETNHLSPQVQPLISKPNQENNDQNDDEEQLASEESSAANEHLTSPVPTSSYPNSLLNSKEAGHLQQQNQQQTNEQFKEATSTGTQRQVNQSDQEEGQLSQINNNINNNNNNNIISNQQSSSFGSVKPTVIKVNQNDNQNVRLGMPKLDQNANPNLESSEGINLAHKNLEPEAPTGLNVENPVAQVVPLQLGIGPINGFVPPKFNNLIPQPQGLQHPLIHHIPQKQKLQLVNRHHPHFQQRPIIVPDGVQFRPPQRPIHPKQPLNEPPQRPPPSNLPNIPLHRAASLLANFAGLSNLNLPFLTSIQRKDSQRNSFPSSPVTSSAFPHGPRSFRSKRSSSKEPMVSVRKEFQVVTSIDLDFNPNSTGLPEIYEGRREEIIYGVCMPFNGLIVSLLTILAIIAFSLISSFILIRRINKMRKDKIQLS
ncbi:myb-like protein I [Tetranychus urticae]|nr:myb-like protein I [Tetranychus urticae]